MAHPRDPDNAGFHSSPSSDRTRIQKWKFAPAFAQALSMVSAIAFASRALYRPRPEAGAHSFAERELDAFSSFGKLRNVEIAQTVSVNSCVTGSSIPTGVMAGRSRKPSIINRGHRARP